MGELVVFRHWVVGRMCEQQFLKCARDCALLGNELWLPEVEAILSRLSSRTCRSVRHDPRLICGCPVGDGSRVTEEGQQLSFDQFLDALLMVAELKSPKLGPKGA
jgi:hypothetical protein